MPLTAPEAIEGGIEQAEGLASCLGEERHHASPRGRGGTRASDAAHDVGARADRVVVRGGRHVGNGAAGSPALVGRPREEVGAAAAPERRPLRSAVTGASAY